MKAALGFGFGAASGFALMSALMVSGFVAFVVKLSEEPRSPIGRDLIRSTIPVTSKWSCDWPRDPRSCRIGYLGGTP